MNDIALINNQNFNQTNYEKPIYLLHRFECVLSP